ncbi:hypothetical protein AC1031_008916 [Aphanomyces cochlioides]|nr:hypothetical protein AC1031_008916 [Aphanomyces cochlioides]
MLGQEEDRAASTDVEGKPVQETRPSDEELIPGSSSSLAALVQETEELFANSSLSANSRVGHPDFDKLTPSDALEHSEQAQMEIEEATSWLSFCPLQAKQWVIYQAKLRPDISLAAVQDLISTVLLARGLKTETGMTLPAECSLYRQKLSEIPLAQHASFLQLDVAKYETVFTRLGVSSAKLRVLRLYVGHTGIAPSVLLGSSDATLQAAADSIFEVVRSAIMDVGYALTILSSPAFCDEQCETDNRAAALDEDYVRDVTAVFDKEMKANLRQLSLPLEEYANAHELACAQLISLLEPIYTRFAIEIPQSKRIAWEKSSEPVPAPPVEDALPGSLPLARGARVTQLVHELWNTLGARANATIERKVREKRSQVERRVQCARELRQAAVSCILKHAGTKTMLQDSLGSSCTWEGAVLYEGSCILGKIPAKLFVTFDRLIFKFGMFMFATLKDIPFDAIERVTKPSVLGISVISLHTTTETPSDVQLTLATDVDRVFELLDQICTMHADAHKQTETLTT